MPTNADKATDALGRAEEMAQTILEVSIAQQQPIDAATVAVAQLYATLGLGYATLAATED